MNQTSVLNIQGVDMLLNKLNQDKPVIRQKNGLLVGRFNLYYHNTNVIK